MQRFITDKALKEIKNGFYDSFKMAIEAIKADGKEIVQGCKSCHPEFCKIIRKNATGVKRCRQERLKSLRMAFETGQPYITICHAGIVLACVPVMDEDRPLGGIFFGKCLNNKPDEILIDDINNRLDFLNSDKAKLPRAIKKLEIVPGRKIHDAAEFLFSAVYKITGLDRNVIQQRRQKSQQQSEIGEFIREHKEQSGAGQYPIEAEKQLMGKVKIGDRIGAREILNMILASIMLKNPGDLAVLRARMLELLSILSRSAVEGGVDADFLLEKNLEYINKAMQIDNQQDLCVWIGDALNGFIEFVYSAQDKKRVSQIKPATDYIQRHYKEQLTLDEIAKTAHLSVSRLSHIFKEQTGLTIVDYLTNVRVEQAKALLISTNKNCTEICFDSGYNNQSYFTRTFKELVGVPPRQFREMNRRKK